MSASSTNLRLYFLLSQWLDTDMLPNSYIKVSYTFTVIGFITEFTLKFISHTSLSFFGIGFLKRKTFTLTLKKSVTMKNTFERFS